MKNNKSERFKLEFEDLDGISEDLEHKIEKVGDDLTKKCNVKKQINRRKIFVKQISFNTIEKIGKEKLANEKIEVSFTQVKRGIKNEKLEVTTSSVRMMLGVFRENQITEND